MGNTGSDRGSLVAELVEDLAETDPKAVVRLIGVAETLGQQKCQALLAEALAIQADGGMKRADGEGFRTLGGIFFKLAKDYAARGDAASSRPKASVIAPVPPQTDGIAGLLRRIAAYASAAAQLISNSPGRIPEEAAQKIGDLRSQLGNVIAQIAPGTGVKPPKRNSAPSPKKKAKRPQKAARSLDLSHPKKRPRKGSVVSP